MLSDIIEALACPACGAALAVSGSTLACASGHSFDVARQGYVNLLPGRAKPSTADTTEMVAARREFLDGGHFGPIADAVIAASRAAVTDDVPGVFLDAGAGTGHLLAQLLDAAPTRAGVALDISKQAARIAARAHERIGSIVADVWTPLPLRDASAALVLVVFSPRNAEEFARVLAPGGALIVVTPNAEHLGELVGPLGLITVDPQKRERLAVKLGSDFEHVAEQVVTYPLELSLAEATSLTGMGPSAAHISAVDIARRVGELPEPVSVTVSVTVGTYRSNPSGHVDS